MMVGGSMTKMIGRIVQVGIATMLLIVLAQPALAQSNKFSFSTRNQKKMIKVITLLQEEGDSAGAQKILEGINLDRAKPYGRARILQMLGTLVDFSGYKADAPENRR